MAQNRAAFHRIHQQRHQIVNQAARRWKLIHAVLFARLLIKHDVVHVIAFMPNPKFSTHTIIRHWRLKHFQLRHGVINKHRF
ncbi:Uncharacterised protein [Vibrio cholerae]|nr:Uncharacterised protein [Vibrio cholerae]CSB22617.1 Uncharacterised protein [Vibrio cholerae]CSB63608.1 Uncharacterised protein [Vibrio cholerae]CSC84903.1 Uncharacterised protein [Vibrio cholerae]CSI50053.1 Uncharacterised protein [Vibrio cholerae]